MKAKYLQQVLTKTSGTQNIMLDHPGENGAPIFEEESHGCAREPKILKEQGSIPAPVKSPRNPVVQAREQQSENSSKIMAAESSKPIPITSRTTANASQQDIYDSVANPMPPSKVPYKSNSGPASVLMQGQGVQYLLTRAPRRAPARFSHRNLPRAQDRQVDLHSTRTPRDRANSTSKAPYQSLTNDSESSPNSDRNLHTNPIQSIQPQRKQPARGSLQYREDHERSVFQRQPLFRGRSLQNMHSTPSEFQQVEDRSMPFRRPVSGPQSPGVYPSYNRMVGTEARIRASTPSRIHRFDQECLRVPSSGVKSNGSNGTLISSDRSSVCTDVSSGDGQHLSSSSRNHKKEIRQVQSCQYPQKLNSRRDTNHEHSRRKHLNPIDTDAALPEGFGFITPKRLDKANGDFSSPLELLEDRLQEALRQSRYEHDLPDRKIKGIEAQALIDTQHCHSRHSDLSSPLASRVSPTNLSTSSDQSDNRRETFTIFDDRVPFRVQPQTPADVQHQKRRKSPYVTHSAFLDAGGSTSDGTGQTSSELLDQVPPTRNHSSPMEPSQASLLSPTSTEYGDGVVARVASSAHRSVPGSQRFRRAFDRGDPEKENSAEAEDLNAIHEERRRWHERGETSRNGIMNRTPPRIGRFERWMHQ